MKAIVAAFGNVMAEQVHVGILICLRPGSGISAKAREASIRISRCCSGCGSDRFAEFARLRASAAGAKGFDQWGLGWRGLVCSADCEGSGRRGDGCL